MHKFISDKALIFLSLFFCLLSYSQELPPIVKYGSSTYAAGNQNWMISQDQTNSIFLANNDGLLEFNGSNWTLYPSPNETIIRSVKVIDNKIYTGCYMDFGYWNREPNGQLKYTSLAASIKDKIKDEEQFWNILNYDHWVLFQSLNKIYIYDTSLKRFTIIAPKNNIIKSFLVNNSIYFQTNNQGLFEIENGKSKLVSDNSIIKNNRIVSIFPIEEGMLLHTQYNGFYKLVGSSVTKMSTPSTTEIDQNTVYSSYKLSDGSIAVGTVSNGIFIIGKDWNIKYHITQSRGLSNNTVLSLFEDSDRNLWVGLDNGINCINLQSPVKSFSDETGILGTVYTSILFGNKLYIGTNQGLFFKEFNSADQFKFVQGTKGQVWSLFEKSGTLFCGHDSGTFTVNSGVANLIYSNSGTWKFVTIPTSSTLLLQGNYNGISILENKNGQWVFRNKVKGFDNSSKYAEITDDLEVYISHEYKGIFRLKLDKDLKNTTVFTYADPIKGKNASLAKLNNTIYYAYKEGIFKLNNATKKFEKDKLLSSVFEKDEYTSGKIIVDASNKIWLFSKNYIHYFTLSKLSYELKQNTIPIPSSLSNSMLGYENITQLSNSLYLIGTTDGYYTMNINDLSFKNYNVSITSITVNKLNKKSTNCSIQEEGKFEHDENNITFSYSVPEYNKYINAEYQYLLEGVQDEWSEWSAKSTINFKNLPPGFYTFKVRAKIANTQPANTVSYSFTIVKPWYFTNLALFVYFIFIAFIGYRINKAYTNYYQKQKEKLIEENNLLLEIKELENVQQRMKLTNEQLLQDVDTKNRELAVSTMSLIKKNDLLALIKEDLKNNTTDTNKSIKSVINTITNNITEEDTWNVFKEAFDNADKDFLKKVKGAHASLTPNDLRLCAYLRLNLSSKEIAPLLNISVRSVEIKRYRLRKKMDLPHEQGLVEYILSI